MASATGRWLFVLLFCGNAYAACPGGATSLDSATTTDAAVHTALSSGSVCITGSSTITVDQTVTIPGTNVLYTDSGVTLAVVTGGLVQLTGGGTIDGFSMTNANGVTAPLKVEGAGIAPTIQNMSFSGGNYPYIVQDSNPPSPTITNNDYNNAQIYSETADNATWSGNTFTNNATKRGIQCLYCKAITVEDNTCDSGIACIQFINSHNVSAARKAIENNIIQDNTISGVSEEAISFESNPSAESTSGVRDYDTVASVAGTDQVVLGDAGWAGTTTYNSGNYYLGFITGALKGNYYKISAHAADTFTLTGMTATPLATIQAGDAVWIGLPAINNMIRRNTISLSTASAYGIVLYGLAFDNTVGGSPTDRNTVTTTASNQTSITCTSLDGLFTGGVAGNSVKAPCDGNNMTFNLLTGDGVKKINKMINCSPSCVEDTTPDYAINGNDGTRSNAGSGFTPGTIRRPIKRLRLK